MSSLPFDRPFGCGDVERFGFAYLDGEFEPSECSAIEAHLHECPSCRAQIEREAAFRTMIRLHARGGPGAPVALRRRITAGLDGVEREMSKQRLSEVVGRGWPPVAVGLAAAASLALVFNHVTLQGTAPWVVADAVRLHNRALPLEVTGDLSRLMPLFQRHLSFAVRPPVFPAAGVALVGGRLSHLGARDAAYLEYGAGPGRRISLFIVSDPERDLRIRGAQVRRIADREILLTTVQGYNVAVWRRNEIVYSMVSDLARSETLALLNAAQPR